MRRKRAFTIYEVVAVVVMVVALIASLLSALGTARRSSGSYMPSQQLRGFHQSMVVFSAGNNTYFPGLDSKGELLSNGPATGGSGPGDAAAARFWILLNGGYISGNSLVNPFDETSVRYRGVQTFSRAGQPTGPPLPPLTTANFSYAALDIRGKDTNDGRRTEWRDTANSQAVIFSERNIGNSNADKEVRSFTTHKPGEWVGAIVWGDNHAELVPSHIIPTTTRYGGITQSNDNLFATTRAAGVTEDSTHPDANALMVWN